LKSRCLRAKKYKGRGKEKNSHELIPYVQRRVS
jgi:hypothetical protein